jgi:hypothetical protein
LDFRHAAPDETCSAFRARRIYPAVDRIAFRDRAIDHAACVPDAAERPSACTEWDSHPAFSPDCALLLVEALFARQ